jgi:hypothetical protein
MLLVLIVFGAVILLARFLAYRLPMGWKFAVVAVVLCFLSGPFIGLGAGVVLAYAGIDGDVISPVEYFVSGMAQGLLASVFSILLVPFFRRQRTKEEALAWKYR